MVRAFWFGLIVVPFLAASSPAAEAVREPLFTRHVEAVFSRLGCNGGTCHGTVKGQNGFRLSLFGADPTLDLERLLRESAGRRLNLIDPASSLLLQKATGQVAHEGGKRMSVGEELFVAMAAAKSDSMSGRFVLIYAAVVCLLVCWCLHACSPPLSESSVLLPCWTQAVSAEPRPGEACCCPSSSWCTLRGASMTVAAPACRYSSARRWRAWASRLRPASFARRRLEAYIVRTAD